MNPLVARAEYVPRKVWVERKAIAYPLAQRILRKLDNIPREIVFHPQRLKEEFSPAEEMIGEGKKYLLLSVQKGRFVKPCPCTPHYIGCNYFIVNLILNCPLDCSYCILQSYLADPFLTVFVNLEDLWQELDVFLAKKSFLRLGTGELGDSLALDHITDNSRDLVSFFQRKPHALFELKTKTVNILNLLSLEPPENVVVSWSLNSRRVARENEAGAPRVEERINAALELAKRGFRVGFHFDPLIRYPGWEDGYGEVIELIFELLKPEKIAWISLGSLRFPPSLKSIIQRRFPKTGILDEELFPGLDRKLRYFRPLREEMYKRITNLIEKLGKKKVKIYFCMEGDFLWEEILKWKPRGKKDVELFLSPHFPLNKG